MEYTHADDEELAMQLRSLVDNDVLEHPTTRAIARLVAECGPSVTAPDQSEVYELYVKPYLKSISSDGSPESSVI
jgi:hypothetical protein